MYHYFLFFSSKEIEDNVQLQKQSNLVIFQSYVNVLITKKLLSNQAAFCLILNLLWNLLPSHEIKITLITPEMTALPQKFAEQQWLVCECLFHYSFHFWNMKFTHVYFE